MHACRIHFTQLSPICRYIRTVIAPSLTNNQDHKPTSSCTAQYFALLYNVGGYTPIYAPRHPHPLFSQRAYINSFLFTVSKKEFIHFVNVFFCIFSLSSCSCLMRPCSKPWTGAAIARCCVRTVASSTRSRSLWSETNFSFFHTRFWRYKGPCFPFLLHITNFENSGWGCLAAQLLKLPRCAAPLAWHAWHAWHARAGRGVPCTHAARARVSMVTFELWSSQTR